MNQGLELRLLAVSVGRPRHIGIYNGAPVLSGIAKNLVTEPTVFVRATDISGDEQADLRVHGGVDKAVYAYPSDHWPWWEGEHRLACRPNAFGENLTTEGADETQVAIGDRFRWGAALLEVSQPRAPCYKFAMHTGRAEAPQVMTVSARCGWYFRVIEEGEAPVNGRLVRERASDAPSVRDAFIAALHPRVPEESRIRVCKTPALSPAWRDAVMRRVAHDRD
jgi:MOSC domain-containing protein YiiM